MRHEFITVNIDEHCDDEYFLEFAMIDVEAVVEAISAAQSMDDLQALFPDLCRSLNVAHVVYHAINVSSEEDTSRPVFLLTYSDEWVSRYFAERYVEIDPIVACGKRAFLPLDWSTVPVEKRRVVDFFRDAQRHGVGAHGITLPIRGPFGERALFTVNARGSARDWEMVRARLLPQFHVLGHFIHERAMRLRSARKDVVPALSRRELECLQRAAKGGTQKSIAWELRLSESAVNLYLKTARHKLGAATLSQAVANALAMEIIEYSR